MTAPTPDAPRYRCPKCGRLANTVAHYPDRSKAICLDGHEWDPFATPGEPATPGEDIGTLLDEFAKTYAFWEETNAEFEREQCGADILDQSEAERDAARAALDVRIAALEQERDKAASVIHSAAVCMSDGRTQVAYLQLFEFLYPDHAPTPSPEPTP